MKIWIRSLVIGLLLLCLSLSAEAQPPDNNNYTQKKQSYLNVKINSLATISGISNVGVEYAWCQYSVDFPIYYSPYTINRRYKLKFLAIQPEFRYWFKDVSKGHFLGAHTHFGYFDIATDDQDRYQSSGYDSPIWGFGLSYGYKLSLSQRWGCEFTIGGGYANVKYDIFYNIPNGVKFDTKEKHYWGVTRAGVNFSYKFNLK